MRRLLAVLVSVCLSCWAGQVSGVTRAFDPDVYRIRLLIDAEVLRPGGPNQGRVESLLKQAISAGDPRIVGEVVSAIENMARHRWIRVAPLKPLFGELERIGTKVTPRVDSGLSSGLALALRLEQLGSSGRRDVYRSCLASRTSICESFNLTWEWAGSGALTEQMDDLLPEVEAAVLRSPPSTPDRIGLSYLTNIAIPQARARQGDWVAGHLELLRRLVTGQRWRVTGDGSPDEHRLACELVTALAQDVDKRALEGLLDIWRAQPAQEVWGDQQTWSRTNAEQIAAGKVDPEVMHTGAFADKLRLAIRALGMPRFQEKNTSAPGLYCPSPKQAESELETRGLLKRVENREDR